MKLEQQVTSLELSKKLKELGVKQKSLCIWETEYEPILSVGFESALHLADGSASAFTVAELGELLPPHYFTTKSQAIKNFWHCNIIENFAGDEFKKGIIANTEADARAKMLIYLLENKLITL